MSAFDSQRPLAMTPAIRELLAMSVNGFASSRIRSARRPGACECVLCVGPYVCAHHGLLHRGSFSIVRESNDTLRFVTADGRTIPRRGYRLEDFVDDEIGGESDEALDKPSREGFRTNRVQRKQQRGEIREPAAVFIA